MPRRLSKKSEAERTEVGGEPVLVQWLDHYFLNEDEDEKTEHVVSSVGFLVPGAPKHLLKLAQSLDSFGHCEVLTLVKSLVVSVVPLRAPARKPRRKR